MLPWQQFCTTSQHWHSSISGAAFFDSRPYVPQTHSSTNISVEENKNSDDLFHIAIRAKVLSRPKLHPRAVSNVVPSRFSSLDTSKWKRTLRHWEVYCIVKEITRSLAYLYYCYKALVMISFWFFFFLPRKSWWIFACKVAKLANILFQNS